MYKRQGFYSICVRNAAGKTSIGIRCLRCCDCGKFFPIAGSVFSVNEIPIRAGDFLPADFYAVIGGRRRLDLSLIHISWIPMLFFYHLPIFADNWQVTCPCMAFVKSFFRFFTGKKNNFCPPILYHNNNKYITKFQ